VITLTFGFLIASVLIFGFGFWVGHDVAEQRLAREERIVRLAVTPPKPPPLKETPKRQESPPPAPEAFTPTPTPVQALAVTSPTQRPIEMARPHLTPDTAVTPTARAAASPQPGGKVWTVQVNATTEAVQAVVLARRLRAKGYDAFTVQAPIAGVTWFRIRVGRFADREAAKAVELRLKREEGFEAAYVTEQ
jgi:cell division septation protein DedD